MSTPDKGLMEEYDKYIEELYNELNKNTEDCYTFTFKIYKLVDLEGDLRDNKPIRIRVSLSGVAEVDEVDQYFNYDIHHFFDKNYGELVIEKHEKSVTFNNIEYMQDKLFKGKDYILVQ